MEVNRVLLEQVGPHDHPDIAQGEEELVVFVDGHQRRRNIAIHHTHVHDLARIHVSIDTVRRDPGGTAAWCGIRQAICVGNLANGAVVAKR